MNRVIILILLTFLLLGCVDSTRNWEPNGPVSRDLIDFVARAKTEIERDGINAFHAFRSDNKWIEDDKYIFVWNMEGIRFVYPPDPAGEGKLMLNLKDSEDKPIGMEFIQIAQQGGGWVHYKWPKLGDTEPEWKSTYILPVTTPSGSKFLVGSGVYGLRVDK